MICRMEVEAIIGMRGKMKVKALKRFIREIGKMEKEMVLEAFSIIMDVDFKELLKII